MDAEDEIGLTGCKENSNKFHSNRPINNESESDTLGSIPVEDSAAEPIAPLPSSTSTPNPAAENISRVIEDIEGTSCNGVVFRCESSK